jgi:integrase
MTINFLAKPKPNSTICRIIFEVSDGTDKTESGYKARKFNCASKIELPIAMWNQKENRANGKGREAMQINQRLSEIRAAVEHFFSVTKDISTVKEAVSEFVRVRAENLTAQYDDLLASIEVEGAVLDDGTLPLHKATKQLLDKMKSGDVRKRNRQHYSVNTLSLWSYFVQSLKEFEADHGKLDLNEHNFDRCFNVAARKKMAAFHLDYFNQYYSWLEAAGKLQNGIDSYVRLYKLVYSTLEKTHYLNLGGVQREFVSMRDEFETTSIPFELYASLHRNRNAYRALLDNKEKPYYDYILIAGVIGLRKSDMLSKERTKLIERDGNYYISSTSKKTDTPSMLQISKPLAELCQDNLSKHGHILSPDVKGGQLNYHIPHILSKIPGFDYPHTDYRVRFGKKEVRKQGPFHDFVTTHTLRRTAATNLALIGIPVHYIKKFCGWSPSTDILERRYLGRVDDFVNSTLMDNLHNKLDGFELKIA